MRKNRFKKTKLGERSDQNLRKITIRTLVKDIGLLKEKLKLELISYENWKINKPIYDNYKIQYLKHFKLKIKPLEDEIKIIYESSKSYKRIFFGIIKTKKITEESNLKIQSLKGEIEIIEKNIRFELGDIKEEKEHFNTYLIKYYENQINRYTEFLNKKLEKNSKIEQAKAIAAKVTNDSRKLGDLIKNKLIKNDICPYCNNLIVGFYHADHIYPISKGGLSTERNMIYVCSDCNLKKSDLTLQKFIIKYNLDRNLIESNLQMFNKDY
ncbi:HNH endonuclease [Flavobacterium solisilvae]|uniref:HNH endonuclease n=1 Tax=Flavobacterium solisilvae TaxID=1852019 RepID=A0ABX1QWH3_9FLAO|nr:HNH endonuclease signature motif containing protein [Flavobacterium solisilvae]NMH25302.1 HNH endonuclease [Flavobacterium solisilvae]